MEKIQATLLTMVIVHDEEMDKLLLINRPSKRGFPGYLGPGGKIELTESFAEGAARELKEETGLEVHPEDLIYKGVDEYTLLGEGYRYIVFNYLATKYTGELLEDAPEGEPRWVAKEEVADLPMQSWFRRRLPYFFEEGTFEISIHLRDFESAPLKESIRRMG